MADQFTQLQLPQQKHYDSIPYPFPPVLSPNLTSSSSVANLIQTIRGQKQFVDSLLLETGAVLFRGYDVKTPEDFNNVIEAFGYEEFIYMGGAATRTQVFRRVYTANESPNDQKIGFHHEMAQALKTPSKLIFFCELAPKTGGETPIVMSHIAYKRLNLMYPKLVEKMEKDGLIYSHILQEDDSTIVFGRGWKSTFSTDDKNVAEQRAGELGIKLEWIEGGGVRRIAGPVPAVRYDKSRQKKVLFVNVHGWEEAGRGPRISIKFGDGSPLPSDFCKACLEIMEEECVAIPWQDGDVLLLDNWAVLHCRRPTSSSRRVLASLCK